MNTNAQTQATPPTTTTAQRVSVVFLQHAAQMISDRDATIAEVRSDWRAALGYNARLEARAERLYSDNLRLQRELLRLDVVASQGGVLNTGLTQLMLQIITENPTLRDQYRNTFFQLVAGFTPEDPIDLTTDEELDDDL